MKFRGELKRRSPQETSLRASNSGTGEESSPMQTVYRQRYRGKDIVHV
jgi:hypothetical protein